MHHQPNGESGLPSPQSAGAGPRPPEIAAATASPDRCVELRPLDWDTAFFGATMGVIVRRTEPAGNTPAQQAAVLTADLVAALAGASSRHYAHVIFRTPASNFGAIWAAERAGLHLVDVGVDSTITLDKGMPPASPDGTAIRAARPGDLPALQDLAAGTFVLSRFSTDPFFSPAQVQAFHREWVTNLYHGLAQVVLIRDVDGRVAGFVSCTAKGDEGRIPLIATDARYRRRGIGRSLVDAALRWFAGAGVGLAHVKTQAHNYPALALYHRAGFTVSQTELTYSTTFEPGRPFPLVAPPAGEGSREKRSRVTTVIQAEGADTGDQELRRQR